MKLRDMMFLVIGGLLVISGMVLNTLISGDAEAQEGLKDGRFRNVICEGLFITDGSKIGGGFGLGNSGTASLVIFGDDGKTEVAYLGANLADPNNEMMFRLQSKSKTDKRKAMMSIDGNGGRFDSLNSMGKNVVRLLVHSDGGGLLDTRDKFGYKK